MGGKSVDPVVNQHKSSIFMGHFHPFSSSQKLLNHRSRNPPNTRRSMANGSKNPNSRFRTRLAKPENGDENGGKAMAFQRDININEPLQ
jgi:hypothetical protein